MDRKGSGKVPVFVFPTNLHFYLAARETHKQLLTIYNPYDFAVRFQVLSTAPQKYNVTDPDGSIRPQCCVDIAIRHLMPIAANCNSLDRFRVNLLDHSTKQVLGKREISAKLIQGEPDNLSQEGAEFKPLSSFPGQKVDSKNVNYSIPNMPRLGEIVEQESLIKPDDSHYCKEILRRVIKHDDPFKESKAKQLRRYIGSNSRIIYYANYDIVSDIFSKGDCWVDDNVYGKRLDRRFFVQELIDVSSKNNHDSHPYVGECYTLACLNCLDEQLVRHLFTLYKKQAEEVHNLSEDDVLEERSRELEKFWGHFITNKLERIKEEYAEYYDTNLDIYGFKVAYHDCEREAVAFFYKRLEEQNTSEAVKLNLLIEAALYSMSGTNDVDTTIFCLQKVVDNEQQLEKFLKKCDVLHMLIREGYSDTVCQLFPVQAQIYSVRDYSTLLSIISWEFSSFRADLLHNIIKLGKERFWRKLASLSCGSSLLHNFIKNGYEEGFKELWQTHNNDQCRYVFSCGKGEVICNSLYANGNRELLKEFLLHYANNNEAVLKDIDSFIDNLDSALNSYVSTDDAGLDKINRGWVVHDEIEKTLPKLIEALDRNTQNVQVQSTSIAVDSISVGQSSKEHMH